MVGDVIKLPTPVMPEMAVTEIFSALEEPSFQDALVKTEYPEYLHWMSIQRKSWIPNFLTPEKFWLLVKLSRRGAHRLPISDTSGKYFTWNKCSHYDRLLHELDLNTGGTLLGQSVLSDEEKKSFISRGLIEEAIASSQLEGAHTTREVAKKMIQEGRPPVNHGQRMIVNNYQTMLKIEEEFKLQPMSIELLLEMHKTLTEGTLDKDDQAGRLRLESEKIVVASEDGTVAYVPPSVGFVNQEIERLIAYANDELADKVSGFVHPVIKAIALHFWMGFLHPFADGNGRLARAIFYWYLLRKGYWAFAFLPVSTIIKKSPAQYARSYLYSEQDDNDLTYFIDYNLRKIVLARRDLERYMVKKAEQTKGQSEIVSMFPDLNHRQHNLIHYFRACPHERTNVTAMTKIYGVSEVTAIKDLKQMMGKNLLTRKKQGRNVFYYPSSNLLVD